MSYYKIINYNTHASIIKFTVDANLVVTKHVENYPYNNNFDKQQFSLMQAIMFKFTNVESLAIVTHFIRNTNRDVLNKLYELNNEPTSLHNFNSSFLFGYTFTTNKSFRDFIKSNFREFLLKESLGLKLYVKSSKNDNKVEIFEPVNKKLLLPLHIKLNLLIEFDKYLKLKYAKNS